MQFVSECRELEAAQLITIRLVCGTQCPCAVLPASCSCGLRRPRPASGTRRCVRRGMPPHRLGGVGRVNARRRGAAQSSQKAKATPFRACLKKTSASLGELARECPPACRRARPPASLSRCCLVVSLPLLPPRRALSCLWETAALQASRRRRQRRRQQPSQRRPQQRSPSRRRAPTSKPWGRGTGAACHARRLWGGAIGVRAGAGGVLTPVAAAGAFFLTSGRSLSLCSNPLPKHIRSRRRASVSAECGPIGDFRKKVRRRGRRRAAPRCRAAASSTSLALPEGIGHLGNAPASRRTPRGGDQEPTRDTQHPPRNPDNTLRTSDAQGGCRGGRVAWWGGGAGGTKSPFLVRLCSSKTVSGVGAPNPPSPPLSRGLFRLGHKLYHRAVHAARAPRKLKAGARC